MNEDYNAKLLSTIRHLVDDDILAGVESLLLQNKPQHDDDDDEDNDNDSPSYYFTHPSRIKSQDDSELLLLPPQNSSKLVSSLPMELVDLVLTYSTIRDVTMLTSTCRYFQYARDDRFMPQALLNTFRHDENAVFEKLASIMENKERRICSKSLSWFVKACGQEGGGGGGGGAHTNTILDRHIFWVNRYFFNGQGRTLLSLAAREGHEMAVRAILSIVPPVNHNQVNHDGSTPLHQAAVNGHANIVQLLLQHSSSSDRADGCCRFDVNARRRKDGATPLYLAAIHGHIETVQMLVQEGKADIQLESGNQKYTPLWGAAYFGQERVVKQLVAMGAQK